MKNYFKEESNLLPDGMFVSLDFCIYSIKDMEIDLAFLNNKLYNGNEKDVTAKAIRELNERLLKDNISNHFYYSIIDNLVEFHQSYKRKRKEYNMLDYEQRERKYNSIENDVYQVKKFVREVLDDIDNLRY